MFCIKFGWNWLSGSGEEDFWITSMHFRYFIIISSWKRVDPLLPRMLWIKFGWNLFSGYWEEDFLIFVNIFSLFRKYFPLEKAWPYIWTNLHTLHIRIWLKFAQRFWRRRFLNFVIVFSLFLNYLPLEKGVAPHLNKLKSTSPKDALCQVWLKLTHWFWRRRWKCEKSTDGRTDRGQTYSRDKRRWHSSSTVEITDKKWGLILKTWFTKGKLL